MPSSFTWDPDLLSRVETLEWRSRVLVEGFLQGLHRSRLRGFSSEFAQYHPYIQGDDPRYVDWNAYARLDRLYVRQFEAETNLRCQVFVDVSGSMAYRSENTPFSKYHYAAMLAASLIRLLITQRDACGLSCGRTQLVEHLSPQLNRLHFHRCLNILETLHPEGSCDLASCIHTISELFKKRGLVILFTDTWDDLDKLMIALQRLRFDHHEACLFQIVDPREMDFAFKESCLFEDMETGFRLPITPNWNQKRYCTALEKHQHALRQQCLDLGVSHHLLTTTEPPFRAFASFLAQRESLP